MEFTFLGTSAGAPTTRRNVSALAVRQDGKWDLFDCGEGTQHQLMRTPLSPKKLRRVFISHLHGDHCFGLFGLLASRSMNQCTSPITVIGPVGLRHMVETVLTASATYLPYPLEFIEVDASGGQISGLTNAGSAGTTIEALPLTHRVTSFAWSFVEPDRRGRFDAEKAAALGVPSGPDFGRLKRGESLTLEDGRQIHGTDLIGPKRRGRRVVIAGDNSKPDALLRRTGPVDLLVHEATYTEPVLAATGEDHGHSTAARVATAASTHNCRNLILTHFSARYTDRGPGLTIGDVEAEARSSYAGGLHLAADFDVITLAADGAAMELTRPS